MRGVGWVSEIGGGIRVLGTRILREVWDADFGGFAGGFGLVVGCFGWEFVGKKKREPVECWLWFVWNFWFGKELEYLPVAPIS